MKADRLLNVEVIAEIAALGHTEYICIADCGLPIPKGVKSIDLSIVAGKPTLMEVVEAVKSELVIESLIIASEMNEKNKELRTDISSIFANLPIEEVEHTEFKKLCENAKCIIRTGENKPFANIIFVGGVNF